MVLPTVTALAPVRAEETVRVAVPPPSWKPAVPGVIVPE